MHLLNLGPALLLLLALLLFVAPFVDLPTTRRLKTSSSPKGRSRFYKTVITYLWLLAAYAWLFRAGATLRVAHAPTDAPWLFGAPWRTCTIAALVGIFFALALSPGIHCLIRPRKIPAYTRAMSHLSWMLPHDAHQRRWFLALSITAGVCEEWILRGVVPHALHARAGLSLTTALLISSALFGWNHLYQGLKAVATTALVGLAFGILSLLCGNLLLPILLHIAMDAQINLSFHPNQLPQAHTPPPTEQASPSAT
ncbi:MAG: CPBP family intramembrane glutamic endopeptidase [Acidobacteriaceae bacterium]